MNHLSDKLLYALAVKVSAEEELSPLEEDTLMHVTECDDCYHLLSAMMIMLEVAQNIGDYAVDPKAVESIQPVRESISAVLKLVVDAANTVLDQITVGANDWNFRAVPVLLAGARGSEKCSSVKKLTDLQNGKNFVAYDLDKKLLMIQLDAAAYSGELAAFLTLSDGTRQAISFERRGDIFRAEVADMEDGNYEITLEK